MELALDIVGLGQKSLCNLVERSQSYGESSRSNRKGKISIGENLLLSPALNEWLITSKLLKEC